MKMGVKAILVGVLLVAPSVASATFVGSTLLGEYSTDLSVPAWCSATSVVGPGVEFECPGPFKVDVSDHQVLYTLSGFDRSGESPFNGFILSDVSGSVPDIAGVGIAATTLLDFDQSRIWFDPDIIRVNFAGLHMPELLMSTLLEVTFASVPEPGSLVLLGVGLAGLGLSSRRRTSNSTKRCEEGCRMKQWLWLQKCAAAACTLACLTASDARAGLTSTVNEDTPTRLDVEWTWDPEVPVTDVPSLTHWYVTQSLLGPIDGGPLDGWWIIDSEMRHLSDPHPELGESGGGQSYYVWGPLFDDATGFGVVWEDPRMYAYHSPPSPVHTDIFHLSFVRDREPAETSIRLTAAHVPRIVTIPEPGSLAVLGLGVAGLGLSRRRRAG